MEVVDGPEARTVIAQAIASLPPKHREIIVLRDLEELTIAEIAERVGATRAAVKVRIHRARALLREYLNDDILEEVF